MSTHQHLNLEDMAVGDYVLIRSAQVLSSDGNRFTDSARKHATLDEYKISMERISSSYDLRLKRSVRKLDITAEACSFDWLRLDRRRRLVSDNADGGGPLQLGEPGLAVFV